MKFTIRDITLGAWLLLLAALPAHAQEPPMLAFSPMNIEFTSAPIAFDAAPVVGAPYSAEAVTEVVQTLSDGNRIVRESKAQVNRDGKGRTRREQGLAMFGPVVGGSPRGDEPRHVQISDPETKTTILLDIANRLAHRMPAPQFSLGGPNRPGVNAVEAEVAHFEMALPAPPPPGAAQAGVQIFSSRRSIAAEPAAIKPVVEDLGKQFMEGVTVEGTKTTLTIPAGQIGNELPINVVSERWFSPELNVLVMSRQSDPRFGETTYRLTNIARSEPSPDLFEVPADFKVIEPGSNRNIVIERKVIDK